MLTLPALFYMHRGFFARALEDNAQDPLGSKYAPSVLAAYSTACSFVGLIKSLFSQHPAITERMWFLFTHVFSCAVSIGFDMSRRLVIHYLAHLPDCIEFHPDQMPLDGSSTFGPVSS